jgi:hypothetical protein
VPPDPRARGTPEGPAGEPPAVPRDRPVVFAVSGRARSPWPPSSTGPTAAHTALLLVALLCLTVFGGWLGWHLAGQGATTGDPAAVPAMWRGTPPPTGSGTPPPPASTVPSPGAPAGDPPAARRPAVLPAADARLRGRPVAQAVPVLVRPAALPVAAPAEIGWTAGAAPEPPVPSPRLPIGDPLTAGPPAPSPAPAPPTSVPPATPSPRPSPRPSTGPRHSGCDRQEPDRTASPRGVVRDRRGVRDDEDHAGKHRGQDPSDEGADDSDDHDSGDRSDDE